MSWVDDALNTPEVAIKQVMDEELPKIKKVIVVWEDDEDNIYYRASNMRCVEAVGFLETGKNLVLDHMWGYLGDEDGEES